LDQNRREIPAGDAEALLNGPSYDGFLFLARDAIVLAVNPETPRAVVDFKGPHAHHIERIHNPSSHRDFSIVKAGGIPIDGFDVLMPLAGSKQEGSRHAGGCGNPDR